MSLTEPVPPPAPSVGSGPARRPVWRWLALVLVIGFGVGAGLRWLREVGESAGSIPPPMAKLAVQTAPAGAIVMIDGRIVGQSPIAEALLTAGPHSLRIEKNGYQPTVAAVLMAAEPQTLNLTLNPIEFARLEVDSTPPGAQVYVDGDYRGVSPMVVDGLQPGIHDLLVEKANYTTHQSRYTLRAAEVRRVTDITLDNKLLLMLKANLEINPRSIGNLLDLAHFHYVNNEMTTASKCYMRARELAALPMPPSPPDTPPEDIAFLQQLFQDEIRRVKTEEDHHFTAFKEYYGNNLDFETFRREYNQGLAEFNRWSAGIRSLPWVLEHGRAALAADHPERAAELFSDYVQLYPKSGAGLAGWTAACLRAGQMAEGVECYGRAVTALNQTDADNEEKIARAGAWLMMGQAWHVRGRLATGPLQATALNNAEVCLKQAQASGADGFEAVTAQFSAALLARDRRDDVAFQERLPAAFAAIQKLTDTSRGNPESLARCEALLYQVQYQMAFFTLDKGDRAKAVALLREVVAKCDAKAPVVDAARHALELLDSGKQPAIVTLLP